MLGLSFEAECPLSSLVQREYPRRAPRFISVVIPTRNRVELVLDAIKTGTAQNYQDYEICIFDNASQKPVADA